MSPDEIQRIQEMVQQRLSIRAIARALGRNVKTVRRALRSTPRSTSVGKLESFEPRVRELAQQGLFAPRILREIRARGYTGSLTILKDLLRSIRGPRKTSRRVVRRFETPPGKEAQSDWSPYRVPIGGVPTLVHCFSLILAYSRKMFVAFYRNEKLPTLLHAHAEAFRLFQGVPETVVYDNQTAITVGRVGGKPLWNPRFLEFAKHHGFRPWVCRPRDPDRKGKVERPFYFIETDFLRGSQFASWDDLHTRTREWLDTVANARVHATTRRVPDEMFAEEQPLLIRLPALPFATERREIRKVQIDGYLSVDGSFYPVPAALVGQYVTVRVHPHRIEVLTAAGEVVAAHRVPDRPCRLPADGAPPARPETMSRPALETAFLARFPDASEFLDGLKLRMNALTPIHLRQIERLAELYSDAEVRKAIERATLYRNFSGPVLERILQSWHPNVVPEPATIPGIADPASLGALDDVESVSPSEYTIDSKEPTKGDDDGTQE